MTQYFYHDDIAAITDAAQTHGIVSAEFFEDTDGVNWQTGVNPRILRQMADLIEFCYGGDPYDALDVGLAPSQWDDERRPPALVVGYADDDQYVVAAPRLDCRASEVHNDE